MIRTVAVLCALDTKGPEARFVCEILRRAGCRPLVIDTGVLGEPLLGADVSRGDVAAAAGASLAELAAGGDRHEALTVMGRGAAATLRKLQAHDRLDGALGLGGPTGAAVVHEALAALPLGVPKMLVCPAAAARALHALGGSDMAVLYSVAHLGGVNRLSRNILANVANAVAGMAMFRREHREIDKPLVAVTASTRTASCVRQLLGALRQGGRDGLVVPSDHLAAGAVARLARDGFVVGVVDLTAWDVAATQLGGGGSDRPVARGVVPHVIVPGGLDGLVLGAMELVPRELRERRLHALGPTATLMRTSPQECRAMGGALARQANRIDGPAAVVLPLRGLSDLDKPGGALHDPDADAVLFEAIEKDLAQPVRLVKLDVHISDPSFAGSVVELLVEIMQA